MLLDAITAPTFKMLARLRSARVFHPRGGAYEATWAPSDTSPLPDGDPLNSGERNAIVRLSRGAGFRPPLPDILGVAVKVVDAHGKRSDQDLLVASVASGRLGRWALLPRRSFSAATFSSVLPYDVYGTRTVVLGDVDGEPATSPAGDGDASDVQISLRLHEPRVTFATVRLGRRLSTTLAEDLRFDPWNTGASLRPAGFLNRLRRPVYRASQAGRNAPPEGARHDLEQ